MWRLVLKNLIAIIKRIYRYLKPKCPDCGGIMNNDDCHIFKSGFVMNVYTCEKCGKKWI